MPKYKYVLFKNLLQKIPDDIFTQLVKTTIDRNSWTLYKSMAGNEKETYTGLKNKGITWDSPAPSNSSQDRL